MTQIDIIGYLAGACLFMMAATKSQPLMRAYSVAACVFYVVYGLMIGSMPVLIINAVLIGIQIFRLAQEWMRGKEQAQTS